jgi:uncharacterized protein GlcG (DUF336 family)
MADAFNKPSITHDLALRILAEAARVAESKSKPFVIAVVDDSGLLKAFVRQDGARHISVQVAQDKAYTAVTGRPTHLWDDTLVKDEVLGRGGHAAIDRLVTLGGGYPVMVDGAVVGAVGVAGGHYSEDMEVATETLGNLGLQNAW